MRLRGRFTGREPRLGELECVVSGKPGGSRRAWLRSVSVHSLSWLVVANGVGLGLATLLLLPRTGDLLAPLTYGRWATVHHNLHLYGWCSLPLVGLLLLRFEGRGRRDGGRGPILALNLWSAAVAFGAVSWLAGRSSGKLFVEWKGAARVVFFLAALALAAVLASLWGKRFRDPAGEPRSRLVADFALLLPLLAIPFVLYGAASPRLYPPINPASGGATGTNLLGSVLGIVLLLLALPHLAGLGPSRRQRRDVSSAEGWASPGPWLLLMAHVLFFAMLPHGDRSHRDLVQIVALGSTGLWIPGVAYYWQHFSWPPGARPWLGATGIWGALLVLDGWAAFLPGVLEGWKFTNALVAHAHGAMAGFVTSFLVVALLSLDPGGEAPPLAEALPFYLWQGGTALMVVTLTALGLLESRDPGLVPRGGQGVALLYGLRWLAGAAMLWASGRWLTRVLGQQESRQPCRQGGDS